VRLLICLRAFDSDRSAWQGIDFAPCLRLARNLGQDRYVGFEYYADLGEIGHFLPLEKQSHEAFAVTDFKLGKFDVELGIGYGLTPGSDQLVSKLIVGYAFPARKMETVNSSRRLY
jgi:hypothetical protein